MLVLYHTTCLYFPCRDETSSLHKSQSWDWIAFSKQLVKLLHHPDYQFDMKCEMWRRFCQNKVAQFRIRGDLACETTVAMPSDGEESDLKDEDSFSEEDVWYWGEGDSKHRFENRLNPRTHSLGVHFGQDEKLIGSDSIVGSTKSKRKIKSWKPSLSIHHQLVTLFHLWLLNETMLYSNLDLKLIQIL